MAWDCAEPNVQRKFDWIDIIVADELHPLELLRPASTLTTPGGYSGPSKQQVRQVWACGA